VRGVGIEIDEDLVLRARSNAFREKVDHLVEFRAQDAFTVDVSPATVVTLYMLPEFNAKLRPILERQLKPGTRVVSHDYPIAGGWQTALKMSTAPLCTTIKSCSSKSASRPNNRAGQKPGKR
jgi:hypothetical protein